MDRTFTKDDYLARKAGWEAVRQLELDERRAAPVTKKFAQFLSLMRMADDLGLLDGVGSPEAEYLWRTK